VVRAPIEPADLVVLSTRSCCCPACAQSRIFAQIFESPAHVSTAAITKENELTVKSFFTGLDKGDAMTRTQRSTVIVGLCVALVASAAWAESSPFGGRWHWNRAQSKR